jgi:hypothetical protein
MPNSVTPPEAPDETGTLRANELELWDRVLTRWNSHVGRQVKIGASIVTFVIVVVGFLGVRSLDTLVQDSVETGVTNAANQVRADIEKDTGRLSELLSEKLASMTGEVGMLEKEADKAEKLVTDMDARSKRFDTLETELNKKLETIEAMAARVDAVNSRVQAVEADLDKTSARINEQMTSIETLIKATSDKLAEVERIASSLAVDVATASAEDTERLADVRKNPPVSALGANVLDALGVRLVPTKLADTAKNTRQTYLLTTALYVEPSVPDDQANQLLDAISKVTYSLDERWFSNPDIVRTNRENNFQFTVTVWGITRVEAKAEFVQGADPICWSNLMSLSGPVEFKRVDCDAS